MQATLPQTISTQADFIDKQTTNTWQQVWSSRLGHSEAVNELLAVWEECRLPNWDGYGADAVSRETVAMTCKLLKSLPIGFPSPSLGAAPDGQVTLEWYKSAFRTLSVSVDKEGFLHYAGLFGQSKRYGTLACFDKIPDEIKTLVQEL